MHVILRINLFVENIIEFYIILMDFNVNLCEQSEMYRDRIATKP